MAKASRTKGLAGEREVAAIYTAAGFTVRGLEGAGDHLCIAANGLTIHSEAKRQERLKLPEWLRQLEAEAPQGTVAVLAHRQNRRPWYATMRLDDLVALMQKASAGTGGAP